MGLLIGDSLIPWEEIQTLSEDVRYRAALQFLHQYNKHKTRDGDPFLWGDEIESLLVKFDDRQKKAVLNLTARDVLQKLQENNNSNDKPIGCFHPELSKYQIETTPGKPYGYDGLIESICTIERNMKSRRQTVNSVLRGNEHVLTITTLPRFGCGVCTSHGSDERTTYSMDKLTTSEYPRYVGITKHISERRGENVSCILPVYRDTFTPLHDRNPLIDDYNNEAHTKVAVPRSIHIDQSVFGIGCCCMQVTFQARNLDEAKVLYDQLIPFAPIMLALSASSPLWNGQISDIDTRWPVLVQCTDDRTREERSVQYGEPEYRHTRGGTVECYLTSDRYNDKLACYDENIYTKLTSEGVDELLARVISHELLQDPLTMCRDILDNDVTDADIFDAIHSTNWRIVRLKLPVPEHNIGWRVEFRPMEVQLTDFENAAFVAFLTLLTRVILHYDLDFTIPMTKVDMNMETASRRNAVLEESFYFRKNVEQDCIDDIKTDDEQFIPMTMSEIMHGKGEYRGLVHYMTKYLDTFTDSTDTDKETVKKYISFITDRATGIEKTRARWMRDFIETHPQYKQDSVVSDVINYDLLVQCTELSK